MNKPWISIFFLFFSLIANVYAQQHEQILNFDSYIIVNKNASIDVTENITVHTNQDRILHGIVRRLPMRYVDSYGITRHTRYLLQQILLGQQPVTYHTEISNNQFAIYMGKLDTLLAPGDYTYTIQYHVNNAVNFLKDADELYWNITGNEWDFPILKIQTIVQLPEGANISHYAGYTGKVAAKEQDFKVIELAKNKFEFVSIRPFAPGAGFTIAVSWPKGFIIQPTWKQKVKIEIEENRGNYIALEITGILLIYFLLIWFYFSRHPKKETIIPLSEPPQNLSPAAMRYIINMGVDSKTFSAAVVSMAAKGALTIDNQKGVFTLYEKSRTAPLAAEEQNAFNALFKNSQSVTLISGASETVKLTEINLYKSLIQQFKKLYFVTNFIYMVPAIILSLLALISTISVFSSQIIQNLFSMIILAIFTVVAVYLLRKAWPNITTAYYFPSASTIKHALSSSLFAIIFTAAVVIGLIMMVASNSIFSVALLLLLVALNLIFRSLLKAPTKTGQTIMEQIQGFKLFLKTTERYRLQQWMQEKNAPEVFEKYLPYAIALDIENEWGEKFNALLSEAGIDSSKYQPAWYTGALWTGMTAATFPSFLNDNLDSALSSVSVSTSASSDNGYSGGGTGGGGGSGW